MIEERDIEKEIKSNIIFEREREREREREHVKMGRAYYSIIIN